MGVRQRMGEINPLKPILLIALIVALVVLPLLNLSVPGLLPGPLSSAPTRQMLAVVLLYAALAVTFDILYGYVGLVAFGHTLWFGFGAYGVAILTEELDWSYFQAVGACVAASLVIATFLGMIALRSVGVAFAMVTLAFAEAFVAFVQSNRGGITGGDEGLSFLGNGVPSAFVGVLNVHNVYLLSAGVFVLTCVIAWIVTSARVGHVWRAIRDHQLRLQLVGLDPLRYKLIAYVISAALATLIGTTYILVVGGVRPGIAGADFGLILLVMVVIGGPGRLWGAALGGVLYGFFDLRLGVLGNGQSFGDLPHWIAGPIAQPDFLLGLIFVVLMLIAPGGLAGVSDTIRTRIGSKNSRGLGGGPVGGLVVPAGPEVREDSIPDTAEENV